MAVLEVFFTVEMTLNPHFSLARIIDLSVKAVPRPWYLAMKWELATIFLPNF